MLPQQLDRALGQGIAFFDPALPSDVGVDVLRLKADGIEHPNRLAQDVIANAISGHGYDGMFAHKSSMNCPFWPGDPLWPYL